MIEGLIFPAFHWNWNFMGSAKKIMMFLQTICLPRNLLKTDFSLKIAIYKFLAKHKWPAQRWCMCILHWLVRPWLCNTCGNCNGNVCMHGGILTQAIFFGVNSSIDLCITFLNFGHWPNYTQPILPHACNVGKYFHFLWRQMLYHIDVTKKPCIDWGGELSVWIDSKNKLARDPKCQKKRCYCLLRTSLKCNPLPL